MVAVRLSDGEGCRASCGRVSHTMKRIRVRSAGGDYSILVQRGLIVAGEIRTYWKPPGVVFVATSPGVWRFWAAAIEQAFAPVGGVLLMDDRESAKRLRTVERLCRELVRRGADRTSTLVAVGGGVVGDVAGLAAAVYMRGIALVQVPTTLLAQVDSSIGGKTGVNLPEGKNLIGAFWPPRLVVTDPELLRSLPRRQLRAGLYEVIKSAVIADAGLFELLERHLRLPLEPAVLEQVVARTAAVKASVVSRDEREQRLRQILNFGHTVGHALEAATHYRGLLHGEAVGWGMVAATEIARRTGRLKATDAERIRRVIEALGPLPRLPVSAERVLTFLHADKKARQGRLHWILPRRIGAAEIAADVPETLVREVVEQLPVLVRS
jgi:3-dehydroquinate synthase